MKLTYFSGDIPNFGDELNATLWADILPRGFLDDDEAELFLGVGSILWDHLPGNALKHVIGSGYGGYTPPPNVNDGSWNVVFVRGPRTAATLGLPAEKAICDSAIFIRLQPRPVAPIRHKAAFMPHFQSLDRGAWADVCALAGLHFVDPTKPVDEILADIAGTDLLMTEAMHGAIVADALRTPWIGLLPIGTQHHKKWLDWSEAIGVELRQHSLEPSTAIEHYIKLTGGQARVGGPVRRLLQAGVARPANYIARHRAARHLQRIAQQEPQLSGDRDIELVTERAVEALKSFTRTHSKRRRRASAG